MWLNSLLVKSVTGNSLLNSQNNSADQSANCSSGIKQIKFADDIV